MRLEEQFPMLGDIVKIYRGTGATSAHRGRYWIVEQILEDGSVWVVEKYPTVRRQRSHSQYRLRTFQGEFCVIKEPKEA